MKTIIDSAVQRDNHFFAAGPKRILALDGGGIRGIISLAFVERIEAMLARRRGGWGFRVADYFDLIGGTSTGAIIATGLALGKSAGEMIELYLTLAKKGFRRNRWIGGTFATKFDAKALRAVIIEQFGQETLGSDKLRCGLGIVAKRIDTGSVWLFHNHPRGMFYGAEGTPEFTPNRNLLLSDLLRASSAAPSYFAPEPIEVAPGVKGLFVDGGVSPHNNPALLLMMLATIQGYGFRWPTGADRLMVASVGTGAPGPRPMWKDYATMPPVLLAIESLRSMMQDFEFAGADDAAVDERVADAVADRWRSGGSGGGSVGGAAAAALSAVRRAGDGGMAGRESWDSFDGERAGCAGGY